MYLSAHPGTVGPGRLTSSAEVGAGGAGLAAGDCSGDPLISAGGVVAGAAGSLVWAKRSTAFFGGRLSGAAEAACENAISPMAAAIFQQTLAMPLLVYWAARARKYFARTL
jgi:hypothetical protein